MIVHSNTKPDPIFLDYVRDGQCRLLVRWNITEVTTDDPMTGKPHTSWNYSERVIWWTLPRKYSTLEEILLYLNGIEKEILDWAEATDTKFNGSEAKAARKS